MNDMTTAGKDKLMNDLKVVVADAEDLMRITTNQAGESVAGTRAQIKNQLSHAKEELVHLQETATAKAKAMGQNTDVYVHANPWKSMAIAAGLGVVIGLLAGRR